MPDTVINVENLSKRYVIEHESRHDNLRDTLHHTVRRLWRRLRWGTGFKKEEFWALKDVSFEVKQGEVVGIIGRNGAGKSTLLKILARITEPTEGTVTITGRVASLLEVGTGFHPELSGRENVFLNGAILGMSRAEIRRKFDEIVAFAEVEKFLDTPVKHYSSGMYVRLAFAVAAHLEPEILIVDEVLAVGDAQFQKKCLGKMQDVSTKEGRTVLFVSHTMPAVLQLTDRCLYLSAGRVALDGSTSVAIESYQSAGSNRGQPVYDVAQTPRAFEGTGAARFLQLRLPRESAIFAADEDFRFIARMRAIESIARMRFSMTVFAANGTPVGSCFSPESTGLSAGEECEREVVLPRPQLAPGSYYCGVAVGKGDHQTGHLDYDVVLETLYFQVSPPAGTGGTVAHWTSSWGNIIFRDLQVTEATSS
jgi:lipopolysaccharide transport system ATP-binding protein